MSDIPLNILINTPPEFEGDLRLFKSEFNEFRNIPIHPMLQPITPSIHPPTNKTKCPSYAPTNNTKYPSYPSYAPTNNTKCTSLLAFVNFNEESEGKVAPKATLEFLVF